MLINTTDVADPASTGSAGIVTVGVALLGPLAGEYAVIVLAALAGAMWALARVRTLTRGHGALLVASLVLTAVVLAGSVAWWLEVRYQWPAHQVLAPVAFAIGALGERWLRLIDALWDRLLVFLGGRPDGGAGGAQ